MENNELLALRIAVADYMYSEGCGCCQDESHHEHKTRLARLLGLQNEDGTDCFDDFVSEEAIACRIRFYERLRKP